MEQEPNKQGPAVDDADAGRHLVVRETASLGPGEELVVSDQEVQDSSGEPVSLRRVLRRRKDRALRRLMGDIEVDSLTRASTRLIWVTMIMLLGTVGLFALPLMTQNRFPMSWFCFGIGVIGGFVSLQQRLKKLSSEEVRMLASSWANVIISPLFGGIFALLFYLISLSSLVDGELFPEYFIPNFGDQPTTEKVKDFLLLTYPASGADFAKVAVWSFAAGYSERLIPDIMKSTIGISDSTARDGATSEAE